MSRREQVLRELKKNRPAMVAAAVLVLLFGVAAFADFLASERPIAVRVDGETHWFANLRAPAALREDTIHSLRARLDRTRGDWMIEPLLAYGPYQTATHHALLPPDREHPLGTEEVGRDVLARIIHGSRTSLAVGFVAVGIYVLIGVLVGALAGFYGGRVDMVLSRVVEVMICFPTLFFVLCVLGLMRVKSMVPIMVVIGLTRWTDVARLVRGEVLKLKSWQFVEASRALGASDARVIARHLLPNAMAPVLVAATFGIAGAVLLESALSFLGFGVPPPEPSWGELLTQAFRYITHVPSQSTGGAWWLTVFPGLAIFITVMAFNLLGEGLRDALDPRLRT